MSAPIKPIAIFCRHCNLRQPLAVTANCASCGKPLTRFQAILGVATDHAKMLEARALRQVCRRVP